MARRLVRFGLAAAAALPILVLTVLLAQATMDDYRRLVNIAEPRNPTARIGYLYAVTPDGHVRPGAPLCDRSKAFPDPQHYFRAVGPHTVTIRNRLGHAGPTAVAWLRDIIEFDWLGEFAPIQTAGAAPPPAPDTGSSHAVLRLTVTETQIRAIEYRNELVTALTTASPACVASIRFEALRGNCVVMLERMVTKEGRLLGYGHGPMCIVPKLDDAADYEKLLFDVPPRRVVLFGWLTEAKLRLGILEQPG